MKIVISSGILKGTTVTDESGLELYKTNNAGELTLYLEGLLKEVSGVELIIQNNPARGAIYEAGRGDGKNLKRESKRY